MTRITIDYALCVNSMRFKVDPSDFYGKADNEIAVEILDAIEADARANLSYYATDMPSVIASIREARAAAEAEEAAELEALETTTSDRKAVPA